ncbi:hypothetical protein FRC06_004120, partial [Ceratobasidium sp. 370]
MNGAYTKPESEEQRKPTRPKAGGKAGKPREKLGVREANSQQVLPQHQVLILNPGALGAPVVLLPTNSNLMSTKLAPEGLANHPPHQGGSRSPTRRSSPMAYEVTGLDASSSQTPTLGQRATAARRNRLPRQDPDQAVLSWRASSQPLANPNSATRKRSTRQQPSSALTHPNYQQGSSRRSSPKSQTTLKILKQVPWNLRGAVLR